jgi:hypothetical protein
MLNYLHAQYYIFTTKNIEEAIWWAMNDGHAHVLEWFKNKGHTIKHNKNNVESASRYGNIKLLKWFKNSDYEFKYDKWAIYYAGFVRNKKVKLNKILNFFATYIHNKKIIIWTNSFIHTTHYIKKNKTTVKKIMSPSLKFIKTIKYKTKNNYIKGYNKN